MAKKQVVQKLIADFLASFVPGPLQQGHRRGFVPTKRGKPFVCLVCPGSAKKREKGTGTANQRRGIQPCKAVCVCPAQSALMTQL